MLFLILFKGDVVFKSKKGIWKKQTGLEEPKTGGFRDLLLAAARC